MHEERNEKLQRLERGDPLGRDSAVMDVQSLQGGDLADLCKGGIIQPGQDVISIVPIEDSLLVEAQVNPRDVAFLHPGQPAKVKLTAYDFTVYGGMDAELESISADTITDKQGNSFYLIRVRTLKNTLARPNGDALPIIPGMIAQVDILTGKRTVLDYLVKPFIKARYTALRER